MAHGSDPHVEAGRQARTLEDLGELTARWYEGTVEHVPGYSPQLDEETEPLRQTLAATNRRGLVPTFSQPGVPIDDGDTGSGRV